MCFVLVMGTTGEANSLTVAERIQLAETWVSSSRGRYVLVNTHYSCYQRLPSVVILPCHESARPSLPGSKVITVG